MQVFMLKQQYRMNERIMQWASQEFYRNQLQAHSKVAEHTLCDLPNVDAQLKVFNKLAHSPAELEASMSEDYSSSHVSSVKHLTSVLTLIDTGSCDGMKEVREDNSFSTKNPGEAHTVLAHAKGLLEVDATHSNTPLLQFLVYAKDA
mgnify:CR=1 FL=1